MTELILLLFAIAVAQNCVQNGMRAILSIIVYILLFKLLSRMHEELAQAFVVAAVVTGNLEVFTMWMTSTILEEPELRKLIKETAEKNSGLVRFVRRSYMTRLLLGCGAVAAVYLILWFQY